MPTRFRSCHGVACSAVAWGIDNMSKCCQAEAEAERGSQDKIWRALLKLQLSRKLAFSSVQFSSFSILLGRKWRRRRHKQVRSLRRTRSLFLFIRGQSYRRMIYAPMVHTEYMPSRVVYYTSTNRGYSIQPSLTWNTVLIPVLAGMT